MRGLADRRAARRVEQSSMGWIADNAVALVALVLSVFALARQWLESRHATVHVMFGLTDDGKGKSDRLIVRNAGPAAARDITATFVNDRGEPWEPKTVNVKPFPIPVLAPGQVFTLPVFVIINTGEYVTVTVSWSDKRWRRQSHKSTVSLTGIPM